MKLDIKSILILALLIICLFFGLNWLLSGNSASKQRFKQLEKDFKELESQKKITDLKIVYWRDRFDSLKLVDDNLQSEITKQEFITKRAEQEAKKSKANLEKVKRELADTRIKIDNIKNNPTNRTGDDLLESLKSKTIK